MMKHIRPQRVRIQDGMGRSQTLASGSHAYSCLHSCPHPRQILLCGLGHCVQDIQELLDSPPTTPIFWVENPAFITAMHVHTPAWQNSIPTHWQRLSVHHALEIIHKDPIHTCVWAYTQNIRLFSEFWGPVLGSVEAAYIQTPVQTCVVTNTKHIVLPGGTKDLIHQELMHGFAAIGAKVHIVPSAPDYAALRALLHQVHPALFFSVNLRGLDADGRIFSLLQACHIPVGLWFVDNPWHMLSALRSPWWKEAHIFVTDASFIPALRAHGAEHVYHLPLAASAHMLAAGEHPPPSHPVPMIFVGRAAFPAKEHFFAAAKVDAQDMAAALQMLTAGGRPDFHWWAQRCSLPLWPGYGVRSPGLGAEHCAQARRVLWLRAAVAHDVHIYGDAPTWQQILPEAPAHIFYPPVDYYTALPLLYSTAAYTLNVTSLLLPHGLTQRHFDVWAAGGFLLTDATPGLEIFPPELVQDIAISHPQALTQTLHKWETNQEYKNKRRHAWQEHILAQHTYVHRCQQIMTVTCTTSLYMGCTD